MHHPDLNLLAAELERRGFAGHDTAVTALARAARAAGVSALLVDVLGDTTQPEVARLRAFGRIASALSNRPARPADGEPVPVAA